jgi:putative transposase
LTLNDQLTLSGISKTAYYYEPVLETCANLMYMELIDQEYTAHPFYGSRRMTVILRELGYEINRKRVVRLMRQMSLEAIYPKPNLSKTNKESKKYPYLLKNFKVSAPNQVWSTDITYIPVKAGFLYLTAIMDWYSRYIIAWRISNTLDVQFCLEALEEALKHGKPVIFNSDQGTQFTSNDFTGILEGNNIQISMDGKGRAFDNIFVERLWRTIKYEEVYIKRYENGLEAHSGLSKYMPFYNNKRPHQALDYHTPQSVYYG